MLTNNYRNSATNYALRGLAGTDLLAFRAVAERIRELKLDGVNALDIGCGAGRSTRFLRDLGLRATGVDVSQSMILEARKLDPIGTYQLYDSIDPLPFKDLSFDVFLASWVVLEQSTRTALYRLVKEAARVLSAGGVGFIVANSPEFYRHRWVSCEVDFPGNKGFLVSGQRVTARLIPEGVTVTDVYWSDQDYQEAIQQSRLSIASVKYPKASETEAGWLDETRVAPWVIYEVLN